MTVDVFVYGIITVNKSRDSRHNYIYFGQKLLLNGLCDIRRKKHHHLRKF